MKRLVCVLSGLLVLPAFAEVAPVYYDTIDDAIEYSADEMDESVVDTELNEADVQNKQISAKKVSNIAPAKRANTNRSSISRTIPSVSGTSSTRKNVSGSRAVASRNAINNTTAPARTTTNQSISRGSVTRSAISDKTVSTRRTTSAPVTNAVTARSGSLYITNDTNPTSARVGTRSNTRIGSKISALRAASAIGLSTNETVTAETVADTTAQMTELAELTEYCQSQYNACMDNYCNVLDDNQGRCSCSANLKNYEKTEAALEEATLALQDVAQKIQYLGLSSTQIETLFAETEAEEVMGSSSDNSSLKSDLDKIKKLVVDVKSTNSNSTVSSSFDTSGLLNLSFSNSSFDLSSMLGNSNTSSISNQRGEDLYKTATAKCKTAVLKSCTAQGVDASVVTNAYDLEIDKQCIAYERSLTDANTEMKNTVRNAQTVLQKARLAVAQQKNAYTNLRDCVNALDSCMQDDFICGDNYELCLDPSGKYISDGEIIEGSTPGQAIQSSQTIGSPDYYTSELYSTWEYSTENNGDTNAWGYSKNCNGTNCVSGALGDYIETYLWTKTPTTAQQKSTRLADYIQNKIGYIEDGKTYGMCSGILNQCQDLTFEGNGNNKKYKFDNNVVREFLQRVLTQIKVSQDNLLSDYSEECTSDVISCLSQNSYGSSNATNNVAINACRSKIRTCMSVTGDSSANPTPTQLNTWANTIMNSDNVFTITYDCGSNAKANATTPQSQSVYYNTDITLADGSNCCANFTGWKVSGTTETKTGSITWGYTTDKTLTAVCQ